MRHICIIILFLTNLHHQNEADAALFVDSTTHNIRAAIINPSVDLKRVKRSRAINVIQATSNTLEETKESHSHYDEEYGNINDHSSANYERLKSIHAINSISQVQSVQNIHRKAEGDEHSDEGEEHSDEGVKHSDEDEEHSSHTSHDSHDEGEEHSEEVEEHSSHDYHDEADKTQDKPFLLVLATTLLVNLITLVGVLTLIPLMVRKGGHCCNAAFWSSSSSEADNEEGVINDEKVSKAARRAHFFEIFVPSLSCGALFTTTFFLIVPESIAFIQSAILVSQSDEEGGHEDHGEEDLEILPGTIARFGTSLVAGYMLPSIIRALYPKSSGHSRDDDEKADVGIGMYNIDFWF